MGESLCWRLQHYMSDNLTLLAAHLEYKTVIEAVSVSTLTDDNMIFKVLLSNTTRILPSTFTWKSCAHVKGIP